MHIHHFTLRKIADHLRQHVIGGVLVEAFSQEKDQVVLGFGTPENDWWLRIACAAPLPHIWPVSRFAKAKRNVFDLFQPALGLRLTGVKVVDWDRVLILELEENRQLILKMHGLNSNVLLREGGTITSIFRNSNTADLEFKAEPGNFNTDWRQELDPTLSIKDQLRSISPLLDKSFEARCQALVDQGTAIGDAIDQCLKEAEDGNFFLLRDSKKIKFLLFDPESEKAIPFTDLTEALNVFFRSWFQYHTYSRHFRNAEKLLKKHLKKYRGQLDSYYASIQSIEEARSPEEIGHILMANLHAVPPNLKKVELHDFYHDEPIIIKLKPELNCQQNAEVFYLKSKKHRSRVQHLEIQIERLEEEMSTFEAVEVAFEQLTRPENLILEEGGFEYAHNKAMHAFVKEHLRLLETGKPHLVDRKHPFLEFRRSGFTILVGKNSKQNDKLTFQHSSKNDLWMHVRDATGSHVIVRNPKGADLPKLVLEYAASLAAYYSKRKREQLVPVQYADRKYIRKVKQGAPGQVIVTREKVIMVEPWKNPQDG